MPRCFGNTTVTKPVPGTLQEGGASFQTTHWTLILRAGQSESTESTQKALSDFCEVYWPPLYAFLRHRGYPSADAQDLAQLAPGTVMSRLARARGKLKETLAACMTDYRDM